METAGAALDTEGWRRALSLLASVTAEVWRVPLAEPLARAAAAPSDAAALGALGSALIAEREAALAASVLALSPTTEAEVHMAARVERMLVRADALTGVTPLDDRDLRGWHFVMTGGLLLHVAPEGQGVRGRYASLADNQASAGQRSLNERAQMCSSSG